jgi:hypothetical protein
VIAVVPSSANLQVVGAGLTASVLYDGVADDAFPSVEAFGDSPKFADGVALAKTKLAVSTRRAKFGVVITDAANAAPVSQPGVVWEVLQVDDPLLSQKLFTWEQHFDTGLDTDGDTLTDCEERNGSLAYRQSTGLVTVRSDPNMANSDGDLLPDNVELVAIPNDPTLGSFSKANHRLVRSYAADPKSVNTDGDPYADDIEFDLQSDAFVFDTKLSAFSPIDKDTLEANGITKSYVKARMKEQKIWDAAIHENETLEGLHFILLMNTLRTIDEFKETFGPTFQDLKLFWILDFSVSFEDIPKTNYVDRYLSWPREEQISTVTNSISAYKFAIDQISDAYETKKLAEYLKIAAKIAEQISISLLTGAVAKVVLEGAAGVAVLRPLVTTLAKGANVASKARLEWMTTVGDLYCSFGPQTCPAWVTQGLSKADMALDLLGHASSAGVAAKLKATANTGFTDVAGKTVADLPFNQLDAVGRGPAERLAAGQVALSVDAQPVHALGNVPFEVNKPAGIKEIKNVDTDLPSFGRGNGVGQVIDAVPVTEAVAKASRLKQLKQLVATCATAAATGGNSFIGSTLVTMADSNAERIDQIIVGDFVSSFDPVANSWSNRRVTATSAHVDAVTLILTIGTAHGVETIHTTPNHEFWTGHDWVPASALRSGDPIGTGTLLESESDTYRLMYNLTVDITHTYTLFDTNTTVHNSDPVSDAECKVVRSLVSFDANEQRIVDYLTALGRRVEKNPLENVADQGRQGDALIDGVKHEFKTMAPGGGPNTIKNQVSKSIKNGALKTGEGQARNIIIDARNAGLTKEQAIEGLSIVSRPAIHRRRLDNVTIIGADYFINKAIS